MEAVVDIITTLGFPIACVIGLAWFAWFMVNKMAKTNEANMAQVQARCGEREEKLYQEMKENREINGKFAEIIAKYDEKLDIIQHDVSEIKTDVLVLKHKSE